MYYCNLQTLKVSEVYSFNNDDDSLSDSLDFSLVSDVDDIDLVNELPRGSCIGFAVVVGSKFWNAAIG